MGNLQDTQTWLDQQLPLLLEKYDVPGAAWAVLQHGEVVDGAAGLLSLATGVEATPDSVFQIGSVTKLWTSTLVLQLVDEGLVDLDAPVRTYLPEFVVADEGAAAAITTYQLLTHTAGFEGDIFTDTGVGDDALERYVRLLGDVPQLFPPGKRFSTTTPASACSGGSSGCCAGSPTTRACGDTSSPRSGPNTFRYRLRRVREVGGLDLEDPDQRFAVMLQLALWTGPEAGEG